MFRIYRTLQPSLITPSFYTLIDMPVTVYYITPSTSQCVTTAKLSGSLRHFVIANYSSCISPAQSQLPQ